MHSHAVGAITLLLLASTTPLLAQGAEREAALERRVNGAGKIRVSVAGERRELLRPILRGGLVSFDVKAGVSRDSIPLARIGTIEARRSAWTTGALIGGGILGSLGLTVGVAATGQCSGGFDVVCGAGPLDVLGATLVGAGTGALIGAVIGAPFRRWTTVYRADDHRAPRVTAVVGRGLGVSVRF